MAAEGEQKRRAGGWTPTPPHARWCQVIGDGLPQSVCAPRSAQSRAHSKGEHRGELLSRGWGSFFWKVFSAASSGSLYMQVLCLIIAPISWQIYCLAANSHPCCATGNHLSAKPCPETRAAQLHLRSIVSRAHTSSQTVQGLIKQRDNHIIPWEELIYISSLAMRPPGRSMEEQDLTMCDVFRLKCHGQRGPHSKLVKGWPFTGQRLAFCRTFRELCSQQAVPDVFPHNNPLL